MIFLECIGSRACLSAINAKNQQIAKQTLGFTLFDVKPSVCLHRIHLYNIRFAYAAVRAFFGLDE